MGLIERIVGSPITVKIGAGLLIDKTRSSDSRTARVYEAGVSTFIIVQITLVSVQDVILQAEEEPPISTALLAVRLQPKLRPLIVKIEPALTTVGEKE